MAEGSNAVKAELQRAFGNIDIREHEEICTGERVLDFHVNALAFQVRVTREYDQDYATGQINNNLKALRTLLLESDNRRIKVFRGGFLSK